ncbi:MAG TPA: GNAT family N-acetyltransferase [Haloplasmataceae bacterium]
MFKVYLAYYDDKVVGWCNANAKLDCLHCIGWRIMDYVPIDELENKIKTKSIFCFMIAKEMQRKGIATLLLERVCQDALNEGFDYVEAYPYKANSYHSSDFGGYVKMYEKFGFQIIKETDKGIVMRKKLK